jgi:hypothetical protein
LTAFDKTAGTDLDALAAFVAGVQRHGKIGTGTDFVQARITTGGAVHCALLATEARATGKTALSFSQELVLAYRPVDLGRSSLYSLDYR